MVLIRGCTGRGEICCVMELCPYVNNWVLVRVRSQALIMTGVASSQRSDYFAYDGPWTCRVLRVLSVSLEVE